MEQRTRYQKIILAILAAMTAVFLALLIYNRTQPGIQFREAFLKQHINGEITTYSGRCKGRNLVIITAPVRGGTAVSFTSESGDWGFDYVVSEWNDEGKRPYDKAVVVTDDLGTVLFRGYLTDHGYLLDENGEMEWDEWGFSTITYGYEWQDEWKDYEPSMSAIAELGTQPNLIRRGSIGLFVMMVFATLALALDVLFPKLFFQLQHFLSVRDPEPSDFYIATQRIGWAVWPVLLAVGYGFAATLLP